MTRYNNNNIYIWLFFRELITTVQACPVLPSFFKALFCCMTYLYRCRKVSPILGQQSVGNKLGRKEICHTLRAKALEWTGRVRKVEPAKIWRDKSTVPSLYSVLCQSSVSKSKSITISGHLKDNLKHKTHIIIIHSYQVSWQLSPQQRSTTHFETNRGDYFF